MYPYHNIIKKRIKEGELISWTFAEKYHGINECFLLIFATKPYVRIIRNYRFIEYLPLLENYIFMDKFQNVKKNYQIIFSDTDAYCDAVFSNVYSQNNLRYLVDDTGELASFAFLLDKKISILGKTVSAVFFSGVGTLIYARGRGYMKQLIKNCLIDRTARGDCLATLSPANDKYYLSCGFRNIEWGERVENAFPEDVGLRVERVEDEKEYFALYSGSSARGNVLVVKSEVDLLPVIKVFSSDGGGVYKVYDGDRYLGYFAYDGYESFEYDIDESLFSKLPFVKNFTRYGSSESRYMARILNPLKLLDGIECSGDVDIVITVVDDFLGRRENLKLHSQNGFLSAKSTDYKGEKVSIEELTDWYFGIKSIRCESIFGHKRDCKITLFDRYL